MQGSEPGMSEVQRGHKTSTEYGREKQRDGHDCSYQIHWSIQFCAKSPFGDPQSHDFSIDVLTQHLVVL